MEVENFGLEDMFIEIDSDTDSDHDFVNQDDCAGYSCVADSTMPSNTIEIYRDASISDYNDNMSDTATDVEIVEYDDYDEYFDAAQLLSEEAQSAIDLSCEINNTGFTKTLNNVKKNSSAGSNPESHDLEDKIQKEVVQICNLLPRFEHIKVYKALCRNRYAENRVELSLWDLLPQKRPPVIKSSSKRKHTGNVIADHNEILNTDSETGHRDEIRTAGQSNANSNNWRSNTSGNKKIPRNRLNTHNSSDANRFISNRGPGCNDRRPKLNSTTDSHMTSQNGLIHPAKLPFGNTEALHLNHVASYPPSLLALPILKYDGTSGQTNGKDVNTSVNTRMRKNKSAFANDRNNTFGSNALPPHAMNVSFNRNYGNYSPQTQTIDHFMQHLSDMVSNKKHTVGGVDGSNNFRIQNRFRKPSVDPHENFNANGFPPKGIHAFNQNKKSHPQYNGKKDLRKPCNSTPEAGRTRSPNGHGLLSGATSNIEAVLQLPGTSSQVAARQNMSAAAKRKTSNPLSRRTTLANTASKNSEVPLIQLDFDIAAAEINDNNISTSGASNSETEDKRMNGTIKKKEVLPPKVLQTYNELMLMFPQIDYNYIKKKCLYYFNKEEHLSQTELLEKMTEYLLENGDSHLTNEKTEQIKEKEKEKENQDINKQFVYLSGLFPDADHFYLRDIAKQFYNNVDAMMDFVQTQLEKPQYPTKAQLMEKIKITEQQKQYTTKFNILQFLDIFPDPFAHFEDPNRQCKFSTDAYEFLKLHFDGLQANTLMSEYTRNNHHLTLTVKAIEKLYPDIVHGRVAHNLATQDIPLLQECAFLTHRSEIRDYIAARERRETEEYNRLKKRNELWVCQCCFDNECTPSKCTTCDDGHVFCNSCVIKGTEMNLAEGKTNVSCFANCNSEFRLSVLQRILSPTQFSILLHKRQEAEVLAAGVEGLVSCPFCHFASIPPPGDKIFKCLNPECMKETCRNCKEPNHVPFKCYESRSDKARLYLEEKMTKALVRKCYRCDRAYFKEDGCNKIVCTCGALMCYICDKQITGYNHFDNGTAQTRGRCPLWSDNNFINAETVRTVAERTLKHIQEKDPNVEVNVTGLIPKANANAVNVIGAQVNYDVMPTRASTLTKFEDEDFNA